jgi:hypothetical protein
MEQEDIIISEVRHRKTNTAYSYSFIEAKKVDT